MFLKNKNFFDNPISSLSKEKQDSEKFFQNDSEESTDSSLADYKATETELRFYDPSLLEKLHKLEILCNEAGRSDLLGQISDIKGYLFSKKFTVAVVGEFSRGKSTLVNHLIEKDIIPTGDIPTTTLPIRVSGGLRESLVYNTEKEHRVFPLSEKSWDAIEKLRGNVAKSREEIDLTRNCSLLIEHDVEIIDTPGVNSQVCGDYCIAEQALGICDCAILPMAAVSPFSQSEEMFLKERILMKKVPRIMVVLTKLDLIEEKQRISVIESVRRKLHSLGSDIPLFLSSENLVQGWEEHSGTKVIRNQLLEWLHESSHVSLKKKRASQEIEAICSDLETVYTCQLEIIAEKEEKRSQAAENKKQQLLRSSQIQWDLLEIDMLKRCSHNFEWIANMTEERQQDILEKVQIELTHVSNPKEWWEKDFPYRMKMEMISLGNALESNLQAFYSKDVNWLNHLLQEKYGSCIPPQNERIADKNIFRSSIMQQRVELQDIKQARLNSRIGTGVATVSGYFLFGLFGLSPLGMAVGIGGGIISEIFMNKRVESQKQALSRAIQIGLPNAFSNCIGTVEQNIREIYISTIRTMKQSCLDWAKVQCDAIDNAQKQAKDPEQKDKIKQKLAELKTLAL